PAGAPAFGSPAERAGRGPSGAGGRPRRRGGAAGRGLHGSRGTGNDPHDPAPHVGQQDPRGQDSRHLAEDDAQQGEKVRAVTAPLSLRIFLVSVAFTVATGVLALVLVRHSFQAYYERWERSLTTLPSEQVFESSASEIARSLLLRLEREPEVKER